MTEITKESLEARLQVLLTEKDKVTSTYDGAIQDVQHWLIQLQASEAKAEGSAEQPTEQTTE